MLKKDIDLSIYFQSNISRLHYDVLFQIHCQLLLFENMKFQGENQLNHVLPYLE